MTRPFQANEAQWPNHDERKVNSQAPKSRHGKMEAQRAAQVTTQQPLVSSMHLPHTHSSTYALVKPVDVLRYHMRNLSRLSQACNGFMGGVWLCFAQPRIACTQHTAPK